MLLVQRPKSASFRVLKLVQFAKIDRDALLHQQFGLVGDLFGGRGEMQPRAGRVRQLPTMADDLQAIFLDVLLELSHGCAGFFRPHAAAAFGSARSADAKDDQVMRSDASRVVGRRSSLCAPGKNRRNAFGSAARTRRSPRTSSV